MGGGPDGLGGMAGFAYVNFVIDVVAGRVVG